jgi:demethylmenaquinone methyltransferase/2-methoxy-6-polyprenyl-1,4-benzoquinol methylase
LLQRDGRAAVLDFNRGGAAASALQTQALRRVVVPVASQLGLKAQYAYLETSIAEFPTGVEQEQMALSAGFSWAQHRPIAGGLMGLLELRC